MNIMETYDWNVRLPSTAQIWSPVITHKNYEWILRFRRVDYKIVSVPPKYVAQIYEISLYLATESGNCIFAQCGFRCHGEEFYVGKHFFQKGRGLHVLIQPTKLRNGMLKLTLELCVMSVRYTEDMEKLVRRTLAVAYFNICGYMMAVNPGTLSAGSSVFRRYFEEARNIPPFPVVVYLRGLDLATAHALVSFISRGYYPDLDASFAPNIFAVANYFRVNALQQYCLGFIMSSLAGSNAVYYMLIGEYYGWPYLTTAALRFILRNYSQIDNIDVFIAAVHYFPAIASLITDGEE